MNRFVNWLSMTDDRFFLVVNRRWRSQLLDILLPRMTHLGGAYFTIISMLALVILLPNGKKVWAVHALFSLALSHVVVQWAKRMYGRRRPYLMLPEVNTFKNPLKDFSFPSGHTTAAFSIAVSLSLHVPTLGVILIPIAITVGISRMYIGLHYPTDCLIGSIIGILGAVITMNLPFL